MKITKYIAIGSVLCGSLFSLLSVGCARSDEQNALSTMRSDLLLEIFRLLDEQDYEGALPKIARFRALDETSVFLNELEHLTKINACVRKTKLLLAAGAYEKAAVLIEDTVRKVGEFPELTKMRGEVQMLCGLRKKLDGLRNAGQIDAQWKAARAMEIFCGRYPDLRYFTAYAKYRRQYAERMEALETDRAYWLIGSASAEAFRRGEGSAGAALSALLDYAGKSDAVPAEELRNYQLR